MFKKATQCRLLKPLVFFNSINLHASRLLLLQLNIFRVLQFFIQYRESNAINNEHFMRMFTPNVFDLIASRCTLMCVIRKTQRRMASTLIFSRCFSPRAPFNQVVMVMLKPSQSHSGGVIVLYNIAQELQFLTGEKKTNPILGLGSPWQPSNYRT